MTVRRIGSLGLTVLAGLLSCAVILHGVRSTSSIDLRLDPALSFLYCALPILSFPVFLLALVSRKLVALQAILAIAYLAVYTALNWRTCASLGYCGSVSATVLLTVRTHSALAFFGAAIFSIATRVMEKRTEVRASNRI